MSFEGANVIFDTWVHPLMMGLEEHLLTMFREDSEFSTCAAPSHLGATIKVESSPQSKLPPCDINAPTSSIEETLPSPECIPRPIWAADAAAELRKIPFFVRGKARDNTERFARERGLSEISIGTLYEAKAHHAR
jgi:light-independent protochlorophyllide reductase subunit B